MFAKFNSVAVTDGSAVHEHNTRARVNLRQTPHQTVWAASLPHNVGARCFWRLPEPLKCIQNKEEFKRKLKEHLSLSSTVFLMSKLAKYRNKFLFKLVYSSLVESRLRYVLLVCGSGKLAQINRVLVLQKRAVRPVLAGQKKRESCKIAFKELNLLTLPTRAQHPGSSEPPPNSTPDSKEDFKRKLKKHLVAGCFYTMGESMMIKWQFKHPVHLHYFHLTRRITCYHKNTVICDLQLQLSWADLYFAAISDYLSSMYGSDISAGYPNLTELREKILALPKIKEWVSKRPVTNV
ncbi:hypothetical protein J6590_105587 [Homalodisca vitripennis]|nr:hypothetical protein J6590_105587 [Homalodisca vitripennis]